MRRLWIVSASDTTHALSAARFSGLVREFFPHADMFQMYDLGLTVQERIRISENNSSVQIVDYPYDKRPSWHNIRKNAGEYGWKPMCLPDPSEWNDLVLWADSGCLLKDSLERELEEAEKTGIYMSRTRGVLSEYTDPRTLDLIQVPQTRYSTRMRRQP